MWRAVRLGALRRPGCSSGHLRLVGTTLRPSPTLRPPAPKAQMHLSQTNKQKKPLFVELILYSSTVQRPPCAKSVCEHGAWQLKGQRGAPAPGLTSPATGLWAGWGSPRCVNTRKKATLRLCDENRECANEAWLKSGHKLTPHSKQGAAPAWHDEQGARTTACTAPGGAPTGAKPLVHPQLLRCREVSTEVNSITVPFRSKRLYHRDQKKDTSVLQR